METGTFVRTKGIILIGVIIIIMIIRYLLIGWLIDWLLIIIRLYYLLLFIKDYFSFHFKGSEVAEAVFFKSILFTRAHSRLLPAFPGISEQRIWAGGSGVARNKSIPPEKKPYSYIT